MATSEQIQQRSDLIGTQVITRNTGKKLGVVNQLWVDMDQREVVVLGLRSTLVTGDQRYMSLGSVRQIGDVILVDDESAIDQVDILNDSTLINHEVMTETGELIGKVRGFKFDTVTGEMKSLVIASIGLPLIPAQVISTYELSVEEVVSVGPERLVVFEGAEDRLNQLTVGLLERLGLGIPPWEDEEEDYIPKRTPTSNQLGSGLRTAAPPLSRSAAPAQEAWADEQWQAESAPQERSYAPAENQPVEAWQDDLKQDAWVDEPEEEAYEPQPLNLPERQKVAEYEREEY